MIGTVPLEWFAVFAGHGQSSLPPCVRVYISVLEYMNVLFCICKRFMTHRKLFRIPLDWIGYDSPFKCLYRVLVFDIPLNSIALENICLSYGMCKCDL